MVKPNVFFPHDFFPRLITAFFLTIGFLICYFYAPLLLSIAFGIALLIILLHEWPRIGFWWITPLYPLFPFILLIILNQSSDRRLILFIFVLCALFDTAGYLFGSLFGKHKLVPWLSPKKSWEGFIAGIVSVFIATPLIMHILNLSAQSMGFNYYTFILIFCYLALAGDLLVSYFKRKRGVKDASNLLPGHGGLLDRFDSILLTTLLVYTCKRYLIP